MATVDIIIRSVNATAAGFAGATRTVGAFRGQLLKHQLALRMAGQDMRMVGRSMTRFITMPMALAGVASVKFAYDYEQAMMKVASLTESSQADMKLYQTEVLKMATATGKSPQDLAEGLYFISSAGFEGKQALNMLEQAARSSSAGMGLVKDNADAMTSAIHAYGPAVLSATKANDVLVQSVISGKMEPAEFAKSLGRVIAPAEQAGVKFWEVGAAVAALSRVGLSARMSTFSLRSLFMSMVKPTDSAQKMLTKYGLTYKETFKDIDKEGLLPVLTKISAAVKKGGGGMRELATIFNANSLNAFLALTGKSADKVKGVFNQLAHSAGRAGKAFRTAAQSDSFKLRQAWYTLQAALTKVGIVLMPIVTKIVGYLNRAVKWFSNLSDGTQAWIIKLALLAAVAGPVLQILGGFITILPTLARVSGLVFGGFGLLARGITGVGVAAASTMPAWEAWNKRLETPAKAGRLAAAGPFLVIGAIAAAAIAASVAIEQSRARMAKFQLSPVLKEDTFSGDLQKQLAKKGWKERVVDGVVYFDYTIKPRPAKGRGGTDPFKGISKTFVREVQARNAAAALQKTVESAWVKAQAAVLAHKGSSGFDLSLMMARKQSQAFVQDLQAQLESARMNFSQAQGPARGKWQETINKVNGQLKSAVTHLGDVEGTIKKVTMKWPKFDYSKGLQWNLDQIQKAKARLMRELYAPPKTGKKIEIKIPFKPVAPTKIPKLLGGFNIFGTLKIPKPTIPKPDKPAMPKVPAIKIPPTKLTATDHVTSVINAINIKKLNDKSMTITTIVRERPFALGGIVTHATRALIGEKGPEAIIPLTNPARATQVMKMAGLIANDYRSSRGRSGPQGAGSGMGSPMYNIALNLPSGLVVSDVDRFGRQVSPYVDRTISLAEDRRMRGEAGY